MEITLESIQTQIPYYLTQEAKENLVKALDRFPNNINYYINKYQDDLLQGDGWSALELISFEDGNRKWVKGILLSNSCDLSIDNKRDLPAKLTFAPIIRLSRYIDLLSKEGLDQRRIDSKVIAIKEQKVTTLFYLPKGANMDDDYIAILDDLHTVPILAFQQRRDKNKLFTLSQVGFYLFLLKLSVHFCRFHENLSR